MIATATAVPARRSSLSDRVNERADKENAHRADSEGVSYATTGVCKATVFLPSPSCTTTPEEIHASISQTPTLSCRALNASTKESDSAIGRD